MRLAGYFGNVRIDAPGVNVQAQGGVIRNLEVAKGAANTSIELSGTAAVGTLVLDAAANVTGEGKIETAKINAPGSTIAQKPANTVVAPGVTATVRGTEVTGVPPAPPAGIQRPLSSIPPPLRPGTPPAL